MCSPTKSQWFQIIGLFIVACTALVYYFDAHASKADASELESLRKREDARYEKTSEKFDEVVGELSSVNVRLERAVTLLEERTQSKNRR